MEREKYQKEPNFAENEALIFLQAAILRLEINEIIKQCEIRYSADMMNI